MQTKTWFPCPAVHPVLLKEITVSLKTPWPLSSVRGTWYNRAQPCDMLMLFTEIWHCFSYTRLCSVAHAILHPHEEFMQQVHPQLWLSPEGVSVSSWTYAGPVSYRHTSFSLMGNKFLCPFLPDCLCLFLYVGAHVLICSPSLGHVPHLFLFETRFYWEVLLQLSDELGGFKLCISFSLGLLLLENESRSHTRCVIYPLKCRSVCN